MHVHGRPQWGGGKSIGDCPPQPCKIKNTLFCYIGGYFATFLHIGAFVATFFPLLVVFFTMWGFLGLLPPLREFLQAPMGMSTYLYILSEISLSYLDMSAFLMDITITFFGDLYLLFLKFLITGEGAAT